MQSHFWCIGAREMCLVAVRLVHPRWYTSSTPPNPLAGFERPLGGAGMERR